MADSGIEPPEGRSWRRRARPLLGTFVEVAVLCEDDAEFFSLSGLAFDRVQHYHASMSFHESTSDVRRIASAAAGETFEIAPETWTVIAAAQAFEAESGGIFDVAIAAALTARGHLPALPGPGACAAEEIGCNGREQAPIPPVSLRPFLPRRLLAAPTEHGGASSASACLRLEADGRLTVLAPVAIDLGGIAKGAAVDAALASIRSAGAAAATVNAGGDMALFGTKGQPITVRGPGTIEVHAGTLADGAIATSGPFGAGVRSNLVVRPGREAVWADRSVSVVAPTCLVADALTKVLAVLGADATPLMRRHGATGFSIDRSGRLKRVG